MRNEKMQTPPLVAGGENKIKIIEIIINKLKIKGELL